MKIIKRLTGPTFLIFMALASIWYMGRGQEVMGQVKNVPVIMYHSVRGTKEGKYIIPKKKLEDDLKYLKKRGYEAVTCSELYNSLKEGREIPSKPVIITFDDGYLNNLIYALPLLEKYDMSAVVSVVGEFTEEYDKTDDTNPAYACLNSGHIKELLSSGRIEIGNHSFSMHRQGARRGTMIIKGESKEHYKKAFAEDTKKCHDYIYNNCSFDMKTYTYPYGQITEESIGYLKEAGYKIILTCYEKINRIENFEDVLILGRFNRDGRLSTSEFMEKSGI